MWRAWGEPTIAWYPCSHMGFLPHLPDALTRLRGFVDARVAAPAPVPGDEASGDRESA
jgi:hypothetical protein